MEKKFLNEVNRIKQLMNQQMINEVSGGPIVDELIDLFLSARGKYGAEVDNILNKLPAGAKISDYVLLVMRAASKNPQILDDVVESLALKTTRPKEVLNFDFKTLSNSGMSKEEILKAYEDNLNALGIDKDIQDLFVEKIGKEIDDLKAKPVTQSADDILKMRRKANLESFLKISKIEKTKLPKKINNLLNDVDLLTKRGINLDGTYTDFINSANNNLKTELKLPSYLLPVWDKIKNNPIKTIAGLVGAQVVCSVSNEWGLFEESTFLNAICLAIRFDFSGLMELATGKNSSGNKSEWGGPK